MDGTPAVFVTPPPGRFSPRLLILANGVVFIHAGLLKGLTALQELHITSCPLSDAAVHAVCCANAKLAALKLLNLSNMHVRHASQLICALCHIPPGPPSTTPVATPSPDIENEIVKEMDGSQELHACACACMHATPAFASQYASVSCPVEELRLDHLLFMHDGALLARALSCMVGLHSLKRTYSSMTDGDVSSLVPTLERLPLLDHIDLSFCHVEAVVANRLMVRRIPKFSLWDP